jgi:hypothetical protein
MGLYAIVKGDVVDSIAISDSPLETDGVWICIDNVDPKPARNWFYKDGVFSEQIIKVYVPKTKITSALSDVWANIETVAATDPEVQAWVTKINTADQHEYSPEYDADLDMLIGKELITPLHKAKLQPNTPLY